MSSVYDDYEDELIDKINELKQQLESLEKENKDLKERLKWVSYKKEKQALEQQLEEAVEVIEFYGDTTNWDSKDGLNDTCIDGVITYSDIYSPWGEVGISVGGKRANEFLNKHREQK